jgi:group I intron endonuclease
MIIIGVYKITNPNGRIYVGQSNNINRRWNSYRRLNCKGQTSLYNSLLKYGIKNHIFEILEKCTVEQLNEREIYWGEYYNVLSSHHLNNKLGSGKSSYDSEETKIKKRLCHKGRSNFWLKNKNLSKEHCNKISKSKKGHPSFLLPKKEYKNKGISKTNHIESVIKAKSIKVYQLDKNMNLINIFSSAAIAAKELGYKQPNIHKVLDIDNRSCKGFIWKTKI